VIKARGQAGMVAFLILLWVVLQCSSPSSPRSTTPGVPR
jgi:hypothetical protein